jgi:hypothetical protein
MDRLHTARFCLFFHKNKTVVEKIARRRDAHYYRYQESLTVEEFVYTTNKYLAATRREENRVEIRVFRSTLCWKTIQATCQFVHTVRIFTENVSVSDLTMTKYLEWLSSQSGYDILNEYLSQRGVSYVSSSR